MLADDKTSYDWTPGSTRLQADGNQPALLLIFDGEGIYQGMLRTGPTTLQYSKERYDEPKRVRAWVDATDLWPAFPPWLRRQATDALYLMGRGSK